MHRAPFVCSALAMAAWSLAWGNLCAQTALDFIARRDSKVTRQVVAVGGFNGDRHQDLVTARAGILSVLFANRDGSLRAPRDVRVGGPFPLPSRTNTAPEFPLAVARSWRPSPLKSPAPIELGGSPAVSGWRKLPSSRPSPMDTVPESLLAVARSCRPSPLKSPTAAATGLGFHPDNRLFAKSVPEAVRKSVEMT